MLYVLLSYDMKDNNKVKTIVVFDCRGLEPVDFSPRMGWKVREIILCLSNIVLLRVAVIYPC